MNYNNNYRPKYTPPNGNLWTILLVLNRRSRTEGERHCSRMREETMENKFPVLLNERIE